MKSIYKWVDDEGIKFKEMTFVEMYQLAYENDGILFICH